MRTVMVLAMTLFLSGIASAQDGSSKTDKWYRASQAVLISGLVLDEWSTVEAINNPTRVSYLHCEDGSQTCQFPVSVEKTVTFRETGWASWYGIQRPGSIVAASVALDAGILTVSHLLYKRGGIWQKVAIGINFAQAGSHLYAGFGNAGKMRSAKLGFVPAGAFSVSW